MVLQDSRHSTLWNRHSPSGLFQRFEWLMSPKWSSRFSIIQIGIELFTKWSLNDSQNLQTIWWHYSIPNSFECHQMVLENLQGPSGPWWHYSIPKIWMILDHSNIWESSRTTWWICHQVVLEDSIQIFGLE